jgi:hypothetical protein
LCWRRSNNGFCLFRCCSGINSLLWYSVCMYICSNRNSTCGLLIGFRSVIVSLILQYPCLLLSICNAYGERGSCSLYIAYVLGILIDKTLLWLMAGHMSILTGWWITNYTKPLCILSIHILVLFLIATSYIYVF